jgi:hypothetical protein
MTPNQKTETLRMKMRRENERIAREREQQKRADAEAIANEPYQRGDDPEYDAWLDDLRATAERRRQRELAAEEAEKARLARILPIK